MVRQSDREEHQEGDENASDNERKEEGEGEEKGGRKGQGGVERERASVEAQAQEEERKRASVHGAENPPRACPSLIGRSTPAGWEKQEAKVSTNMEK